MRVEPPVRRPQSQSEALYRGHEPEGGGGRLKEELIYNYSEQHLTYVHVTDEPCPPGSPFQSSGRLVRMVDVWGVSLCVWYGDDVSALKYLPRSYKLWYAYLGERRKAIEGKVDITHKKYQASRSSFAEAPTPPRRPLTTTEPSVLDGHRTHMVPLTSSPIYADA
jgi:hypothetical protein